MAKISTRHQSTSDQDLLSDLQSLIILGGQGAITTSASNSVVALADTVDDALEQLQFVIDSLHETGESLTEQATDLAFDNINLRIQLLAAMTVLDRLSSVSFDEALDHATRDLMDSFTSSGAAEISYDGNLVFEPQRSISKSDLKPILRDATIRWLDVKVR